MKSTGRIAVLDGDRRQRCLAELLAADGHRVTPIRCPADLPALEEAELVLFPIPACGPDGRVGENGLAVPEVLDRVRPGTMLFGGRIPALLAAEAEHRGLTVRDYAAREEFAIANALPTAEGALGLALTRMEGNLQGADCLVLGYGRIGKLLSRRLALLGGRVTVSARKRTDLAWIRAEGFAAVETAAAGGIADRFDLICSTVPAPVLDEAALARVRPDALLLELASAPGGFDMAAAEALGLQAVRASGLPGKTAPRAAARAVRDGIYQMMEEYPC